MKNEDEKKGLFARLTGRNNTKKSPCCGSFVIEEIPEEKKEDDKGKDSPKEKRNSCCG
ncbi:MAG: hypothetical protein NT006_12795 [Candidatus Aminicenantes bacterium]|nr:hypothetical protein [Candidatus Aminicenantes bacterium]